jgi:hypothetical protein
LIHDYTTAASFQGLQAVCTEYNPRKASPSSDDVQRKPPTPVEAPGEIHPISE